MELWPMFWLADMLTVGLAVTTVVVCYAAVRRLRFVTRPLVLLVARWQLLPALVGVVVGHGLLPVISPARWWIVTGVAVPAELVLQLLRRRLVGAVKADPVASAALASSENRVSLHGWLYQDMLVKPMTLLVLAILALFAWWHRGDPRDADATAALCAVWLVVLPLRAVWPLWAPGNTFLGEHEGGGGG